MLKNKKVGRPKKKVISDVKKLRENSNLTFEQAIDQLCIKASTLYNIESETKTPSIRTAKKMCEVYGCSLDEIFKTKVG